MRLDDLRNLLIRELPTGYTVEVEAESPLHVVIKTPSGKKGIRIAVGNILTRIKTDQVVNLARMCQLSLKRAKNGITEFHYGV